MTSGTGIVPMCDRSAEPSPNEVPQRPLWHQEAACRGLGPARWFPERGDGHPEAAQAICAVCPVTQQCEQQGMAEHFGVWAGKGERRRRTIRQQLRAAGQPVASRRWLPNPGQG